MDTPRHYIRKKKGTLMRNPTRRLTKRELNDLIRRRISSRRRQPEGDAP